MVNKKNARLHKFIGDNQKHEFFIVASVPDTLGKAMEDKMFFTKECAEKYCTRNQLPKIWVRRMIAEFVEDK